VGADVAAAGAVAVDVLSSSPQAMASMLSIATAANSPKPSNREVLIIRSSCEFVRGDVSKRSPPDLADLRHNEAARTLSQEVRRGRLRSFVCPRGWRFDQTSAAFGLRTSQVRRIAWHGRS
jgi:hypothetical protein